MRQSPEDRARYYRQLRRSLHEVLLPELTSARAIDTVGLLDRILAEFVVEEEAAPALSAEFGGRLAVLLGPTTEGQAVTPARFDQLRAEAAAAVAGGGAVDGRALARTEREFLERVDALRRAVLEEVSPESPDSSGGECSVSAAQLTDYLRSRLAGSPAVVVERLTGIPGGRSKETILAELSGTSDLPARVIVRKDRPVGLLQTRAADEFAVMKAVHDFGGVPVPEPFLVGRDGLGEGTFLVMECVVGARAGEYFPDLAAPPQHRREIGLHLAASLGRLHSLPLERLAGTGLVEQAVTEEAVVAMVEGMVRRIGEATGPPSVTVAVAYRWLIDHVADVAAAPRLCLLQGDFGLHNTLVEGDRVTALVDWEGAALGPPARELAAAWSAGSALVGWPGFLEAYLSAGGRPEDTDPRAIAYYRVFLSLGGYMTSKSGGHLFRTGAKRDLLTAHSGLDSNFRCARNLARALDEAMEGAGS